jgi:hypothetical protein
MTKSLRYVPNCLTDDQIFEIWPKLFNDGLGIGMVVSFNLILSYYRGLIVLTF